MYYYFNGDDSLESPNLVERKPGSFNNDFFFTATSATCVTGLIRVDTYSHWSWFGQFIIILLIQIGGIGFMTFCIYALTLAKKKIGIISRSIMQNSISSPHVGGIVKMTKFIILATFFIEALGAFFFHLFFVQN